MIAGQQRRATTRGAILAGIACAVCLTACGVGNDLRGSIARYEIGNYNAAAAHCDELILEEDRLRDKAHVRYLVYCGLTQYHLGQRKVAHHMLARGRTEYERGRSGWLKPAVVDEMLKVLDELEGRPPLREPRSALSDSHGTDWAEDPPELGLGPAEPRAPL